MRSLIPPNFEMIRTHEGLKSFKMGERKLSFKIPLQGEIEAYIREKKNWPDLFIKYYAEKFWNNYQAQGWKLSNGNPMKDWKAAFNSQWQNLKYDDDIKMLQSCGGKAGPAKVVHMMGPERMPEPLNDIDRLDQLLVKYAARPTGYTIESIYKNWPVEALTNCYKAIREHKLWDPRITKQDLEGLEERRLKATVIVRTLDYYGCKGWTFSDTIKTRKQLQ